MDSWLFNLFLLRVIVWFIPRAILVILLLIPVAYVVAWLLQVFQLIGRIT